MANTVLTFDIGEVVESVQELSVLWRDGAGVPNHLRRRVTAQARELDVDLRGRRLCTGPELLAVLANLLALRAAERPRDAK